MSDDVVARMRGMLDNIARQLLVVQTKAMGGKTHSDPAQREDELSGLLAHSTTILSHCYALAIEGQIARRLEQQSGVDPVLTPLMQELIAVKDEGTAELAMAAMSAQARFMQSQRRMDLSINDLTADLFHEVLQIWNKFVRDEGPEVQFATEARLRNDYDESSSRPGLISKLVTSMNGGVQACFSLKHAGIVLFASGIGSKIRQPRELVVLACLEQQIARLALTLSATGLKIDQIAEQLLLLHGEVALPEGFTEIGPEQALELLTSTQIEGAS
ncbi:MAG TPA: hypothetical protein DCS24_05635 [Erythrobacter sp.]|nr:hypothetical protein [Erythrobacter sp.]